MWKFQRNERRKKKKLKNKFSAEIVGNEDL
jgi:hypothetical protein